jgi:hypothetical protein
VAKRNTPRGPSRKRRSGASRRAAAGAPGTTGAAEQAGSAEGAGEPPAASRRERRERASKPSSGGYRDPLSVGERPRAPWHPLPLSELLILVGAIATIIGFRRGEAGQAVLFAGIGAVAIGTIEVTWREHMSGYRSHAIILALLPTLVFHSVVGVSLATFTNVPRAPVNVALLLIDVALFAFLYKVLRARFLDARRERTFAARR